MFTNQQASGSGFGTSGYNFLVAKKLFTSFSLKKTHYLKKKGFTLPLFVNFQ